MSMQPIATGHPTPEELLAFVDGDTTPEVTSHLQSCVICSTDAKTIATTQVGLRQALYRFDCPQPHQLGEYELDVVEPDERLRIASHAADCDLCGAELRMLRQFLATEPPVPVTLFEQARRVIATLLVPRPGLALAGIRGAETQVRVYQVDGARLSIGPGTTPGSLVGLLVLESAGLLDGEVLLVPAAGEPQTAPLDELGNFEFDQLPRGTYALEVHLPDQVIIVQELRVD
jgi:hypothetical protein